MEKLQNSSLSGTMGNATGHEPTPDHGIGRGLLTPYLAFPADAPNVSRRTRKLVASVQPGLYGRVKRGPGKGRLYATGWTVKITAVDSVTDITLQDAV